MRLMLNLENTDDFREFEISDEDTIETLKYIAEAEFAIPFNDQEIFHNAKLLKEDSKTLKTCSINENDMIILRKKQSLGNLNFGSLSQKSSANTNNINNNIINPQQPQGNNLASVFENTMQMLRNNRGNANLPTNNSGNPFGGMFSNDSQDLRVISEISNIKDLYLNNPDQLNYLFSIDNVLAEALVSGDEKKLEELVKGRIQDYDAKKKKEYTDYMQLANSDPNDLEAQKKIEEIIRMKNIDENMKMAHEYLPESFGHIHMLYINLEINKHKIVGLVDTGAQTTIISEDLARKCGLFNLCDTRYSGVAKGVGVSKIIGVIHAAQIKVGSR
jgi:DNA damage-inducible protein 1